MGRQARKATTAASGSVMTEALVYVRVSSEKQRDGVSPDAQLRECTTYVSRQHGWVLHSEYMDVMSGKRDDRPDYQRMLDVIRRLTAEGRKVAVVVWRLDRLGRRLLERVETREELTKLGVETHSAMEGFVSDVTANVLASIAQEEVRVLGERVRGALRQIESQGWCKVARPPLGYISRDATPEERSSGAPRRVLAVDERTSVVVREAFRKIAAGESTRAVSRWLAGLPADDRCRRSWDRLPTYRMLTNPVYIARQYPDDDQDPTTLPVQKWPAIITDEEWRACQEGLRLNARLRHRAETRHLLTGLIRCPREGCPGRFMGHSEVPTGDQTWAARVRYRCDRHYPGHRCTATLPAVCLEQDVLRQVTALLDVPEIPAPLKRELRREWDRLRGASAGITSGEARHVRELEFRAKIEQGRKLLANATRMRAADELDRDGYALMCEEIRAEMDAAARKLAQLEDVAPSAPVLPSLDEALRHMGEWRRALTSPAVDSRRVVLAELVAHIDPVKIGYGKYEARITWTPAGKTLRSLIRTLDTAA